MNGAVTFNELDLKDLDFLEGRRLDGVAEDVVANEFEGIADRVLHEATHC